ncbi:MAG: FAD-binding oxidoreductase [Paracoccaceae bacterium]
MTLSPVTDAFVNLLRGEIPAAAGKSTAPHYLEDPRGIMSGTAGQVIAPANVDEVSAIITHANAARVGIVPFGGGTGLVGGQLMPKGPAPLVLSLERMNAIREVRAEDNAMIVEAGAILQDVRAAAENADRLFPLSLASQGSCRIGGNLATNAGGVNVLRYGTARDLCLGLEAVLPDGQIWHGSKRLRKDNTGYDLKNLLIGSEGTLAVITAASLRLYPRSSREGAALMVVKNPAAAIELLAIAGRHVGDGVSAFELINGTGLEFLSETMPDVRQPFSETPEWAALIDIGLAGGADPGEALARIYETGAQAGLVNDGLVAQSEAQRQAFWSLRDAIPEANKHIGPVASHDISLPLGSIRAFIKKGAEVIATKGDFRVNCFGHLGDGNLHYNVFPARGRQKTDYPGKQDEINRLIYDLVAEFGGSFSAEHGVGRMKVSELERYADPAKLAAMRAIKAALDPNGIMNPGAVLR